MGTVLEEDKELSRKDLSFIAKLFYFLIGAIIGLLLLLLAEALI